MARFLRSIRVALLFAIAGAVPSCATNVGTSATGSGRSAIDKCRDTGGTDDEIDTIFTLVRAEMAAGVSAAAEVEAWRQACLRTYGDAPAFSGCIACAAAVVDEVYGL